jgi:hypothetical protein
VQPRRSSKSVLFTVLLSVLVAAGAVGGAALLRDRQEPPAPTPAGSATQPPPSTCRIEPCQVLASTTVISTSVELLADAGNRSGRLRIGGSASTRVIESTITSRGVTLTASSMQCVAGPMSACVIRGALDGGIAGEVVVGRSGKWNMTERPYFSDAGYLALVDVTGDGSPEVVTVQQGVFAQVFAINGDELGCTRAYARLNQLPGWPAVKPDKTQLKPCP